MRAMKGQVHFEWQMEVDRTGQERKYAEREAHQETQKIKIRPGHTTPRAQPFTSATCRCGARVGIRDAGPVSLTSEVRLGATSTLSGSTPLSCGEQQTAADDRCPSVPRSDDCPGARLPRGARPNRASGGSPPGAKSPGESLHAPRWPEARAEAPDQP